MNYQKHYDALMTRARERVIDGYIEKHHIVPRCLGGLNDKANIARLTPEEHYLAHQLLVKIHPRSIGLAGAALMMSGAASPFTSRSNKTYGWLRRRLSALMKGRKPSPEAIAKIAAKNRGKVRTEEFKQNVGKFHTGRKRPAETGEKISLSHKVRCRTPEFRERMRRLKDGFRHSDEGRANMSVARKGMKPSDDTKAKMRAAKIGKAKSEETKRRMGEAQKRIRATKAASGRGSKLSEEQVRSIRQDKRKLRDIAADYGMSHHYICKVRAGKAAFWATEAAPQSE